MWTEAILLRIFDRFPPAQPIFKDSGPRAAEEYADEAENPFARWFGMTPAELLLDRDVLDVGCGYSGRPVRFAEHDARVAGVEISQHIVDAGSRFASDAGVKLDLRVGTGEAIPFPDESFDLVTMFDVMEHVVEPSKVLAECLRVLRPGGRLALVFPPYYDITAGSHLPGYATTFPALNLFFTTRALRSATRRYLERSVWPWRDYLRDVPTDKLWNMNGLTVRKFHRITANSGFRSVLTRYIGHLDHRLSRSRGVKRAILMPAFLSAETLARLPVVREAFCWRVVAMLEKP